MMEVDKSTSYSVIALKKFKALGDLKDFQEIGQGWKCIKGSFGEAMSCDHCWGVVWGRQRLFADVGCVEGDVPTMLSIN